MKILFIASEGLPYSKTGGLADVVGALPKALAEMGHEVAVLLPRYRGNKITSILVSSVTVTLGDRLRFPAIGEGPAVAGGRYFFVADRGFFACGDRVHEARVAAGRDSLPRLADGAGAGAAAHAALGRSRGARVAGGIHDSQYRFPGNFFADGDAHHRPAGHLFHDGPPGILRPRQFSEGRAAVCGLPNDGEPPLGAGNSDAGIWYWSGRSDTGTRGPADRHFKRRGLFGLESGGGHLHRAELFSAQSGGEEGRQERFAAAVQAARGQAGMAGAAGGGHRVALRGSERVRSDRADWGRFDEGKSDAGGAGHGPA